MPPCHKAVASQLHAQNKNDEAKDARSEHNMNIDARPVSRVTDPPVRCFLGSVHVRRACVVLGSSVAVNGRQTRARTEPS